jgi:hypothetical protein
LESASFIVSRTNHIVVVFHVDGVRLTATSNRPIFFPQTIHDFGEPVWNDIDRGKTEELGENCSS